MNKKIDGNNRSFVRALMMVFSDAMKLKVFSDAMKLKVFSDAMKLKYIAIKTNKVTRVCFLSFQSNVSATAN